VSLSSFSPDPDEIVIKEGVGVYMFQAWLSPSLGRGVLTDRRFVHRVSLAFSPEIFITHPDGVHLDVPLGTVRGLRVETAPKHRILYLLRGDAARVKLMFDRFDPWFEAFKEALAAYYGAPLAPEGEGLWRVRTGGTDSAGSSL
jgi:hypothetical protein